MYQTSPEQLIAPVLPEPQPSAGRRTVLRAILLGSGAVATAPLAGACGEDTPGDAQTEPPTPAAAATAAELEAPDITAQALSAPEPPDLSRLDSHNEVVRGIGGMEKRAGRQIFAGPLVFFDIPADDSQLRERMTWHPDTLTQIEGAQFTHSPVVILEPAHYSLADTPTARARLSAWATAMRQRGISASKLGRVVVEPEPIVGGLSGSDPYRFVERINASRAVLHDQFPGVDTTILVDTASQERRVLVSALRGARQKGRLEAPLATVGIQAYGNGAAIPFGTDGKPDISRYLTADMVTEIAGAAGTTTVWITTGIIRTDHNSYSHGEYTAAQRIAIAHAVADVVDQVRMQGIQVDSLVLFAENKLQKPKETPEKRDFSFHPGDEPVLIALHDRLRANGIPLLGFDVA